MEAKRWGFLQVLGVAVQRRFRIVWRLIQGFFCSRTSSAWFGKLLCAKVAATSRGGEIRHYCLHT